MFKASFIFTDKLISEIWIIIDKQDNCAFIQHQINKIDYYLIVSNKFSNALLTKDNKVRKKFNSNIY